MNAVSLFLEPWHALYKDESICATKLSQDTVQHVHSVNIAANPQRIYQIQVRIHPVRLSKIQSLNMPQPIDSHYLV